jgi:hypothetical protein
MIRELSASSMSEVLPLLSSKVSQTDTNESLLPMSLCPTRAYFSYNTGLYNFFHSINYLLIIY